MKQNVVQNTLLSCINQAFLHVHYLVFGETHSLFISLQSEPVPYVIMCLASNHCDFNMCLYTAYPDALLLTSPFRKTQYCLGPFWIHISFIRYLYSSKVFYKCLSDYQLHLVAHCCAEKHLSKYRLPSFRDSIIVRPYNNYRIRKPPVMNSATTEHERFILFLAKVKESLLAITVANWRLRLADAANRKPADRMRPIGSQLLCWCAIASLRLMVYSIQSIMSALHNYRAWAKLMYRVCYRAMQVAARVANRKPADLMQPSYIFVNEQ